MKTYDWIIAGGGIAGISLCEILTREGHSVALIEKNNKLASETTREFHEWVHTGSLYTLEKDKMKTLKYILGSLDDLLEFYPSFKNMNLIPTSKGLKIDKTNKPWFNPNLKEVLKKFAFPLYFIDFETAGQVVPIVLGTSPYYPLPFQWSVHKWESRVKEVDKGKSFLKFNDQDIERQFIVSLLDAVGDKGTIFAHSAKSVEIKTLERLKEKDSCKDLSDKIDKLIARVEDTAIIAKNNFYSPLMNGDWGVKSIIKAIPDCKISYEGDGILSGGADAGLAWFICTDPKTTEEERKKQKKLLLEYCSKDTLALCCLIKYFFQQYES